MWYVVVGGLCDGVGYFVFVGCSVFVVFDGFYELDEMLYGVD